MKKALLPLFTCAFLLTCLTGLAAQAGSDAAGTGFDRHIAAVNGVGITKRDFVWAYSSEEQRRISSGKPLGGEEKDALKRNILEQLINREVLYQESIKKGIIVSELKIEQEFEQVRSSMMTDIDMAGIKAELDMDESHIKDEFRRVFAIEALLAQELIIDDSVSETEARNFYDTNPQMFIVRGPVFVRHILFRVDPGAGGALKARAREKAEAVYEKVIDGADFSELARSHSEGPSASSGGAIGWVRTGRTVKAFEEAAFALGVGEVSGIVETQYGYHIIKVTEKQPDTFFKYDDIRDKLSDYLKNEKSLRAESAYVETLRKRSEIEYFGDITDLE